MPLALAEKLISERIGRGIRAGEVVVAPVDMAFAQDGTGPPAARMGNPGAEIVLAGPAAAAAVARRLADVREVMQWRRNRP